MFFKIQVPGQFDGTYPCPTDVVFSVSMYITEKQNLKSYTASIKIDCKPHGRANGFLQLRLSRWGSGGGDL